MRIGLVGYGGWGRVHASAIGRVEGLSLSGVVAGDDASARQVANDLPGVPVHRTLDALLADPGLDLVDIVGPNHLHADMAIKALEAGKHVLLEKPMATTLADSERLVAAAERSGRHCGIVLQLRVSRQWAKVRELIAEGALGRMRFANLTLFRRPFGGGAGNWRRTPATVGSWILEEPIHYIDLLLWYFRERGLPVEVSASGLASPLGPGMSDAFTATMTFADGSYAVFSQCLAGFELKLRRAGAESAEIVAVEKSGEVFELEEQLRRLLVDVPAGTPLVSVREAMPSHKVCLEIERALAERRAIPMRWP
jgi:myo-inositol 2-dehydrogenase/D-chiro-inositol 1-dehydrogenase